MTESNWRLFPFGYLHPASTAEAEVPRNERENKEDAERNLRCRQRRPRWVGEEEEEEEEKDEKEE